MQHVWSYLYNLSPVDIFKNPIDNNVRIKYLEEVLNYIKNNNVIYKDNVYLDATLVDLIIKDPEINNEKGLVIRYSIIQAIYADENFDYLNRDIKEHNKLVNNYLYKDMALISFHKRAEADSAKGILSKVYYNIPYAIPVAEYAAGMAICYAGLGTTGMISFVVATVVDKSANAAGIYRHDFLTDIMVGQCAMSYIMSKDVIREVVKSVINQKDAILKVLPWSHEDAPAGASRVTRQSYAIRTEYINGHRCENIVVSKSTDQVYLFQLVGGLALSIFYMAMKKIWRNQ